MISCYDCPLSWVAEGSLYCYITDEIRFCPWGRDEARIRSYARVELNKGGA